MNLPGGWELVLIVLVIMVLFGAKRLPDASRSLGRSLRIFKAETQGLREDGSDHDLEERRKAAQAAYDRAMATPPPAQAPAPAPLPPAAQAPTTPLPSSPAVPGVAPAPGSVPSLDQQ